MIIPALPNMFAQKVRSLLRPDPSPSDRRMSALRVLIVFAFSAGVMAAEESKPARPNIIVIMADDMGFSDLGCYGSEIATPNIDRLAADGLRFTQFYNNARCCPTRASLLTGLYPHQTGVGFMIGDLGRPAYQGY